MAFNTSIPELIDRNQNGLLGKAPHWERVRLGDVVAVKNGAAFKSKYFNSDGRGMPLLRIRDVVRGDTETWYDGPFDDNDVVRPGDLVIGMDGDFNHALWSGPPALLNQRVCRLDFKNDLLSRAFVLHVLGGYLEAVNLATPSVTVKHLSSRTVADLLLPHPASEEQDRITERIDSLALSVTTGADALTRALNATDRYRRALLAACFPGVGVDLARLEEVAAVQSGIAKGKPKATQVEALPYVRTANVQAGYLDLETVKTLLVTPEQRHKYSLQPDDVLILEGGDADKVGRGWIWEGQIAECLHQNHVFSVRPDKDLLLPRYLAHYVNAPQARIYFLGVAKQTVNLASINRTNLMALPVPLPPLAEQQSIVDTLDRQLAAVDAAAANLRTRLFDADRLMRSLLAAATDGRLLGAAPRAAALKTSSRHAIPVGA